MANVLLSIENLGKYTCTRFAVRAFLFVVCALTLALPIFFRPGSSLFYGFEAYFHLSHGPVSYVLSLFSYVFGVDVFLIAKFLPVVLGIFSLMLFFSILKSLGFKYRIIILASLILIFSPSFIFLFATLTDFTFVAFLMLLIFYLLLRNKQIPALVLFYIIPFFGLVNFLLALVLLVVYSLNKKRISLVFYILPSFVLLFFSLGKNLFSFGSFISDFGGTFGVGLFIVVLSFFGLRVLWKEKYVHFYFYIAMILLIAFSFINLRVLSYLNFILAFLSALGLELLFERHWRSRLIKYLTLVILIIGLLISSVSYISSLINGLPNKDAIDGLYALRDIPNGIVFSHESREYWIGFANKPFVDGEALLYTRNIDDAKSIIESNDISYIWIDSDMKSSVWVEEDQGLLFLLKYSKSFKEVYSNEYVSIWEFQEGVEE